MLTGAGGPLGGITGMEKTARPAPDLAVVAWLRSPEGAEWVRRHLCRVARYDWDPGILADVLPQPESFSRAAQWPEPWPGDVLKP